MIFRNRDFFFLYAALSVLNSATSPCEPHAWASRGWCWGRDSLFVVPSFQSDICFCAFLSGASGTEFDMVVEVSERSLCCASSEGGFLKEQSCSPCNVLLHNLFLNRRIIMT